MIAPVLPPARVAWSVWGLGAALYLIGFYQRVAPAVMTGELMADFQIGAAALGNLSAYYFYSYVAMQVPTGILADTWGPRRLLITGALLASLGTALFAASPGLLMAGLGRLLIGGSVAVAFVCMLKLSAHWIPPRQFALASGMALFIGIVGAVFAGVPLRILVAEWGWRPVMLASALATFAVAVGIWRVVRDDPTEKGYASHVQSFLAPGGGPRPSALAGLRRVLGYRNAWLLYFVPGGVVGCVLSFSGLWGVPFLTTHYAMPATQAAATASALLIAFAVGGPVFGALSDRIGRRKPLYVLGCAVLAVGWPVILLVPGHPPALLVGLLVVVGFFSGCMIISFAFAKESVPPAFAGTASGWCNMGVMMGPMVLQPAVGWMLDRHWTGLERDGVRLYDLAAYQAGFALMVGWITLSLVLVLFTRETFCRQTV